MPARFSGFVRRLADLLVEAYQAVAGRPLRSTLTTVGVALGVATFVATLGITASAADAVSEQFDAVAATQLTIRYPVGIAAPTSADIAAAAALNGVTAAGAWCSGDQPRTATRVEPATSRESGETLQVAAAQATALQALGAQLLTGRWPDAGHDDRGDAVVLLDRSAARRLGIGRLDPPPVVFLDGVPHVVAGTYDPPPTEPRLVAAAILPYAACATDPDHFRQAEVVVRTQLGAPQQVSQEVPLALYPAQPERLSVSVPPDLSSLRRGIEFETRAMLLGLAAVSLTVAALAIANLTYVAVLERRGEIGLRRATGASRTRVAWQFLAECGLLGGAGGALGVILGVNLSGAVALHQDWLVILDPRLPPTGLAVGLLTGMLAGLYPALVAARLDPAEALRS